MTYLIVWRWNNAESRFETAGIEDRFRSLVWTERWQDYGDASLTADPGTPIRIGDYLTMPGRRMCARVTRIVQERDAVRISAEDSLALLDKRIIAETVQDSQVQNFVRKMLTQDNIILTAGETATSRTIPVLALGDLTAISASARIMRSYQPVGKTLLSLAKAYGFNPYAVMSGGRIVISAEAVPDTPKPVSAENALSGWGIGQENTRANVCYVGGQIIGGERAVIEAGDTVSGMDRTEIFADRRDLPAEDMTWEALTEYYGEVHNGASGGPNAMIGTITSGTASPYQVEDFMLSIAGTTDAGNVYGEILSLKDYLSASDLATLRSAASTAVPAKVYRQCGFNWSTHVLTAYMETSVSVTIPQTAIEAMEWSIDPMSYWDALDNIGEEVLASQEPDGMTWAEIERMIPYAEYGLGDVIRAIWESGERRDMRVSEIVESWDSRGYKATPTLAIL